MQKGSKGEELNSIKSIGELLPIKDACTRDKNTNVLIREIDRKEYEEDATKEVGKEK